MVLRTTMRDLGSARLGGEHEAETPSAPASGAAVRTWSATGAAAAALAVASVMLASAAFYNGLPLLYRDSIDYLLHGEATARALLAHDTVDLENTRSLFYGLALHVLRDGSNLWPVVAFQALLTASTLWLTMRVALGHRHATASRLLVVTALLTTLSSAPWFVGYVMPDLFAALLVLGIYLVAFGWERLRGGERAFAAALVWLAIVSHGSHLLLAAGLTVAVALFRWRSGGPPHEARAAVARLAGLTVAAALSTVAIHAAVLGEPTLGGRRPVFLLARAIADGPTRSYLERHCGELDLAICADADHLPHDIRGVLWNPGSVWETASPAVRERLRAEEMPVVLAGIRSDPWGQLRASLRYAWSQLGRFGLEGSYAPEPYLTSHVAEALPNGVERFARSRQARLALHEDVFDVVQAIGVVLALFATRLLVRLPRPAARPLIPLAMLTGAALAANAAITGVLSSVEPRYQARIVWLLPFFALVVVFAWLDRRRETHVTPRRSAASSCTTPRA